MFNVGDMPGMFGGGLHGPQLAEGLGGFGQIASIPMTLNNMFSYRDPNQSWLMGGLGGAMSGAATGSMFGPIGTGIGAGVGYLGGKK
jgi:hypothetical protein